MASTKQITFLEKLVAERADTYRTAGQDASADAITTWAATWIATDAVTLSTRDASKAIDRLIAGNKDLRATLPKKAGATSAGITEDGMYRMDGVIYKAQMAVNGSGNLYAKELKVSGEGPDADVWFDYAPGVVRKLRPEHKLTLDEAKAFGALYGTCCVCARTLTNEASIEAGIGPVCAEKF